jgi:hypothetical protein
VMGSMLATFEQSRLDDEIRKGLLDNVEETHIHSLLAGGDTAADQLGGLSSAAILKIESGVRNVFDFAFATTLELSALVAIAGAVVAFRVIPRLRAPEEQAVESPLNPGGQ